METLVVVHHRNDHHQYYNRKRGHGSAKLGSFGSAPAKNFWGNSCRAFQSAAGLLPTPLKSVSTTVTKTSFSASPLSRTPSASINKNKRGSVRNVKTNTGPIPIKLNLENEVYLSESWAGTAYSNSPPPSSLPLPMFALGPKRTVSLDLPRVASEIDFPLMAKSAPASPTRGQSPSRGDLVDSTEYATKTLRRILNLEITDE